MKKKAILLSFCFAGLALVFINGCKKDTTDPPPTNIGTRTSFTEEFTDVFALTNNNANGWVITDNSSANGSNTFALWGQGYMGLDKAGVWYGFSPYSYTALENEFAYSYVIATNNTRSINSWLISPVLSVKNGDKISFYTRGDTTGVYTDRMQVLMNKSSSSNVGNTISSYGDFKTVLFDINSSQMGNGYPTTWTKYEYIFSGISGNIDTRIAFRHYLNNPANARGVAIDQFKFEVN